MHSEIGALTLLRLFVLGSSIAAASLRAMSQTFQGEKCAEPRESPYTLKTDEELTRSMRRNERHIFRLSLKPKQSAHVVVEQKGIDTVVKILDPQAQLLIERDSPNSKFGPEAISVVAQVEGTYLVEVCSSPTQPVGSYDLKLEGPRDGTAADDSRVAAERLLMEARRSAKLRTADSYNLAIEKLNKAVEIWRILDDKREEGYAFCEIGEAQQNLRNLDEALKYLNLALERLNEKQDFSGQAYVFNQMGAAHRDLGNPPDALPAYDRALELRNRISDRWGQAQIHNNIGLLYSQISDQEKAIAHLELALAIWREMDDRAQQLNTLNNIALANLELGNLTVAFQQYQTILDSCDPAVGPCNLEAYARNSQGVVLDTWGETNEALTQYYLALDLFRKSKNKTEEARVLDNIGMAFAGIGDSAAALEQFQEALKIREKDLKHLREYTTRSNLGYVRMLLKEYPEALNQLRQAQHFSQLAHNPRWEAYSLQRMGAVHLALNEKDQALASYEQALEIQTRIGDRRGQAITLDRIGELYSLMGQSDQALTHYEQALKHWNAVGDRQGEAMSLYGIARVERSQNKLPEAREKIVKAIEAVESLLTRMTSHRLRMSYLAAKQDYYELEIDIRMLLYKTTQSKTEMQLALSASERARARNLLDLLTEAQADIRQGVDPQLLATERTQRDQLTEKLAQFQELLNGAHTTAQESTAEKELQALTRSFDQTQAEIRRRSPRYASLTQPQPLKAEQIQQLLDDNSVLLEYALGEERSYLWVVTRTDIQAHTLPPRLKIERAVELFRESLTAQGSKRPGEDTLKYVARLRRAWADYPKNALELSSMVLGPVFPAIGNKRLIIVSDGALHYVPFAALPIPNESDASSQTMLIAKHDIVYEPSASALALIQNSPHRAGTKTLAVFADPVFDARDERVRNIAKTQNNEPTVVSRNFKRALRDAGDIGSGGGTFRLDRLQYSRGEADAIVAAVPPGSFLKAVDFDASRARFLNEDLRQFRIVHLATHGILNTRHPELSGLVFSLVDKQGRAEDGFVRLGDIYNLTLPADMVVLSACRTGVGELVRGEGLVGLTRGFMHAGATRVVASLWKVEDEATAELMKRFYSNMLQKQMTATAALRQAQLDLMQRRRSPYFWAGFILQGEWK